MGEARQRRDSFFAHGKPLIHSANDHPLPESTAPVEPARIEVEFCKDGHMPEFHTREDVENWLKARELEESILIAARTALRNLPTLMGDKQRKIPIAQLQHIFGAAAVSWYAGTQSEFSPEILRAAANVSGHIMLANGGRDAYRVTKSIRENNTTSKLIGEPDLIVLDYPTRENISDVYDILVVRTAMDAITESVNVASRAVRTNADHAAFTVDAAALEKGASTAELSARPLWPDARMPKETAALWNRLKARLPVDQDWDVWIDWYESRLHGDIADMELEKVRILIPTLDWGEGPARANAITKRLVAEFSGDEHILELKDIKDINVWLRACKREEITLLAARGALRVLPVLAMDKRKKMSTALLLNVFRAASASWFAVFSSPSMDTAFAAGHARTAARTADHADVRTAARAAAHAASYAASSIAMYTATRTRKTTTHDSYFPAASTMIKTVLAAANITARTEAEAAFKADTLMKIPALLGMPLWPGGQIPEEMAALWDNLKSKLPEGEDWDVWTTWYEARLRGDPADEGLEKARIEIPKEDWKKGPAHVNGIIKRLIAEHAGLDFEKLQEIAADAETTQLGSPEELKARSEVEERAEAAEAALLEGNQQHGGMGHNQPPEELQLREDGLVTARESVAAIGAEARAETPDIARVAQNASVLKRVVGWVAEKLDMTVNAFCKAFGATLGSVAAVGIPATIVLPPYWGKIVALIEGVWNWLRLVLG